MFRLCIVLTLCFLAITSSTHAQTVEDGWKAYDAGKYESAKHIFEPLAKSGNAEAMNAIGLLYSEGKSYPKNMELGCDWYEKSAKAGYISGQFNYSRCYMLGEGRSKNESEALTWCKLAAEQGHRYCQISLMHHYHDTAPDKAKHWGKKAANAGSRLARAALWHYYNDEFERPPLRDILCFEAAKYLSDTPLTYCD